MSFDVEYAPNAIRELEDIYLWIKARAPITADRWRDDFITKVESLSKDPHRHRPAPEASKFSCDIRQLLFRKNRGQFRIIFTIRGNKVIILTVRHHSRRPLDEGDLPPADL